MNNAIDITAAQRKIILALLRKHLPNTTAWVYGSRATWNARPQSDLDMVVFTTPAQERGVSALRDAFEESALPFRVDLFVWDAVPESFHKQIEAEHVVLVEKEEQGGTGEQLFDPLPEDWEYTTLGIACHRGGGDIQTGP
ncbi:MAG: nucleotidyltransferase domain-containing protein, partial [Desulfurellaceae bacterium]|nr:nucleotidyltransferase domain-containing protein [Desulfurellaceae bacterium]